MDTRCALEDAAGNPIWSRDTREVEVDRVFDTLNRPTTITSDDATTAKLRRQFTYIAYSATDTASMAKNLFGRVGGPGRSSHRTGFVAWLRAGSLGCASTLERRPR
ncbi:MAG: hypothetical protein VX899_04220 [Myxococcota bacterium]|nr:hypothetical protein [Myxococcota bacterium]